MKLKNNFARKTKLRRKLSNLTYQKEPFVSFSLYFRNKHVLIILPTALLGEVPGIFFHGHVQQPAPVSKWQVGFFRNFLAAGQGPEWFYTK